MWRVVYDEHFSSNVKPSNGKVAGNRPNDQFWNDAYSWMSLFTREKKRWLVFDVMYLFPNRLTQQQDVCVLVWWAVLPLCVPPCSAQRERQFPFWRTSYTPRTSLIHISVSLVWYFTPTVLIFNRNRKIKKNKKKDSLVLRLKIRSAVFENKTVMSDLPPPYVVISRAYKMISRRQIWTFYHHRCSNRHGENENSIDNDLNGRLVQ